MKTLFCLLSLTLTTFAADLITHAPGDGKAAFTFDKAVWSTDEATRRLPIGVFDSGIGGLTVMEAILKLDAFHNDTLAPGADGVPDFMTDRGRVRQGLRHRGGAVIPRR